MEAEVETDIAKFKEEMSKKKEDKLSLRNAAGEEILRTRDTRDELAAACFLLPGLTFPEKGGFALALIVLPPAPRE